MSENDVVMGVDGCPAGWLCFRLDACSRQTEVKVFSRFTDVIGENRKIKAIAVDIPIGLPDSGPRVCDLEARRLLQKPRSSSVFPPPVRSALIANNYRQACARNRRACGKGLTIQTYTILKKIREVDDVITRENQSWIHEVHPELCFWALNTTKAMRYSKRKAKGREERQKLLLACYPTIKNHIMELDHAEARVDDLLDAAIAAWTAERIAKGKAGRIPENPVVDRNGLRMEMWY